ncbi:MAG: DUF4301 family protein [Bacteroidales bacterium]|nr:DUF4301 family protein [Bacteroidales bacterium]
MNIFNNNDRRILEQKGISVEQAEKQIELFKKGVKPVKLIEPAVAGKGIEIIDDKKKYIGIYETTPKQVTKFVPASGAASRMFKSLFEFNEISPNKQKQQINSNKDVQEFFASISNFAFFDDLNKLLGSSGKIYELIKNGDYTSIIDGLLETKGLSYGVLPKGLLKFHSYSPEENRTPFEEHLVEGALYAQSDKRLVNLHFTVSPEHLASFRELADRVVGDYENKYSVKYRLSYSVQKPSTDTLAVNADNTPFYDNDGSLLFRPGGHGALIENLNEIDSDIIFIKNIDNVTKQHLLLPTIEYKKVLAGKLLEIRQTIYMLLGQLTENPATETINMAIDFLKNRLMLVGNCVPESLSGSALVEALIDRLNRPLRVCGVVRNLGEPGGGPYFTESENGCVSVQIVESSQVDGENPEQMEILKSATHFNPVDIVCSVKDFKGKKFDLRRFIDNDTCFISRKSKSGRELKALELPGLWNGAMAFWNSVYVEVPVETFNPVKTVNDLLRKAHQ